MKEDEIKLLPCPFCGKDEACFLKDRTHWYVECDNCQASTYYGTTRQAASTWWNCRNASWIKVEDEVPAHRQDCIVISNNGAVRRAIFWKTPKDSVGTWHLDAFHKVVVSHVVLWSPFPKLLLDDQLTASNFALIIARCPNGHVKHTYPAGYDGQVASFCEHCGTQLESIGDAQYT